MSGHVFISYSHAGDSAYVEQLADHLATAGVRVWFDHEIVAGDRWQAVIREQVVECAALIVVMSPPAEASKWVQAEVHLADELGKPILPLLREGEVFFRLTGVHYEDVKSGGMPSDAFVARLRSCQPPPRVLASHVLFFDEDFLIIRHAEALKVSLTGDHAEAVRLYREVVADRSRVLGADHPDTLSSLHELALNLGEVGDRAEAMRLYREVVADRSRVLGTDHPHTLTSKHELAVNAGATGNPAEAVRLLREVVADELRVLGADHPSTLTSRFNLAANLSEVGDRAEAVRLLREVVADEVRVLGADHPSTLTSRLHLGINVGAGGDRAEAVRLLREVVADEVRVLGADHPDTVASKKWLTFFGR